MAQLFERDEQLRTLEYAADAANGSTVFVAGDPGCGKTALVEAFVDGLDHRHRVRIGRCDPFGAPTPLDPIRDTVSTWPARVTDLLDKGKPSELYRALFEELSSERSVLVIEDVHFADEATVDLIGFLGRRMQETTSLLLVTYRPGELARSDPLLGVLGDLGDSIRRLDVGPLSLAAVSEMSTDREIEPADLYESTGGNPFLTMQTLLHPGERLPRSIAEWVASRVRPLPKSVWTVLDHVSLAPEGLDMTTLRRIGADAPEDADLAIGAGLLSVEGVKLRPVHDLVRIALEELIAPVRRTTIHASLLSLLEHSIGVHPSVLAHHAVRGRVPVAAVEYSLAAAQAAIHAGSHREAAAHHLDALEFREHIEPSRLFDVLIGGAHELYLVGHLGEAADLAAQASEVASNGDQVGLAFRWRSRLAWARGDREAAERYAHRSVAALEDDPSSNDRELAFAYSNLAQLSMLAHDAPTALRRADRALSLARGAGDLAVEVHALTNRHPAGTLEGDADLNRALQISLDNDLPEHAARAASNLAWSHLWRWDVDDAGSLCGLTEQIAENESLDLWAWYVRGASARIAVEREDWDEAARKISAILNTQESEMMRLDALVARAQMALRTASDHAGDYVAEAVDVGRSLADHQRRVLSAAVEAEATAFDPDRNAPTPFVIETMQEALDREDGWGAARIAFWMLRIGHPVEGENHAPPIVAELDGDILGALEWWRTSGARHHAHVLAGLLGDRASVTEAVDEMRRSGADGSVRFVRSDRRRRGLWSPRGPNSATVDNPVGLTERQMDVLRGLEDGMSNQEIADRLYISHRTVEHHVAAIFRKLGVTSRADVIALDIAGTKSDP